MTVGGGASSDPRIRDWPATRLADALRSQLADAWDVIDLTLRGLTDDEYFWEPVPDCWSVRRRDEARTPEVWGSEGWVVEYAWTPPSPPPFTTIAWRLMHAYDCTNDYVARGLHLGPQSWNDVVVAPDAATAVTMITDLVKRTDERLSSVDDETLRRTSEGDPRPGWATVSFAFLECTHHCAEVGVLRDLHRTMVSRR